jgi:hypothetical protein
LLLRHSALLPHTRYCRSTVRSTLLNLKRLRTIVTTLKKENFRKIVEQRISPVNRHKISVFVTHLRGKATQKASLRDDFLNSSAIALAVSASDFSDMRFPETFSPLL